MNHEVAKYGSKNASWKNAMSSGSSREIMINMKRLWMNAQSDAAKK
jgi:hypothetical protein